jgi:hypothetical protein
MEDNLNLFERERRLNILNMKKTSTKIMQQKQLKVKTMVVAPLRVT